MATYSEVGKATKVIADPMEYASWVEQHPEGFVVNIGNEETYVHHAHCAWANSSAWGERIGTKVVGQDVAMAVLRVRIMNEEAERHHLDGFAKATKFVYGCSHCGLAVNA